MCIYLRSPIEKKLSGMEYEDLRLFLQQGS